ncbi:unnamed protein product [Didymodactylos carnosus]|uniref:Uncharacterized protein n=1 Tax=Didymodactylos carnosus TaxID=1234261 RepID=A0A8S2HWI0_9BILA|nr:unnamed protein product [Didymodactylos carnosus]CAF3686253.1 unnamed protein product [Didymodactylos carnosus]
MTRAIETVKKNGTFVEIAQWEIMNIITDIYNSTETTSWNDNVNDEFKSILGRLINKNRVDAVLFIYRHLYHVRDFFNQSKNCRTIVDHITGNELGGQLIKTFIDKKPLQNWIIGKDLIFILLQKKERKFLKKLFLLFPFLVHQLDEDGNDPLLHICLKVRGCRHRFVQFLTTMKADLQRINFNGEDFFGAIHLERNRKLLKKLNMEEINHEQRNIRFIEIISNV